jgi:DNA gyrase/topoisomerase IV subunit B
MPKQVYDASAIQALKGLEPVRRMPGMYTHTIHPLHLVQEAIDNAVDEALAGFGKRISVSLFKDGSVEVADEGRGVPVDLHPVEHKPAVEVAFTMLHAGGKFPAPANPCTTSPAACTASASRCRTRSRSAAKSRSIATGRSTRSRSRAAS